MRTSASGPVRSGNTAIGIRRSGWVSARRIAFVGGLVALVIAAAVALGSGAAGVGKTTAGASFSVVERVSGGPTGTYVVPPGIHKIRHVIVIQQENRSFDLISAPIRGLREYR
jgi:phospholipase C